MGKNCQPQHIKYYAIYTPKDQDDQDQYQSIMYTTSLWKWGWWWEKGEEVKRQQPKTLNPPLKEMPIFFEKFKTQ